MSTIETLAAPVEPSPGPVAAYSGKKRGTLQASRLVAPGTLALILIVFSVLSPVIFTVGNLFGILGQVALLALAAIGLTLVVRAGGIDLSIGVALDLGALASAWLIHDGYRAWVAVAGGLLCALAVGAVNALLIVILRIPAFLATLSVWFAGTSVQQLLTGGGAPIYLSAPLVPDGFAVIGRGYFLGIDAAIVNAVSISLVVALLLGITRYGRKLTMAGEQPSAARISGLRTNALIASAYLLCAVIAGFAGVVLAARSNGYVPGSGQAYLMDAIGAVFIGATISRYGRVSVGGTLIGVVIFGLLDNGLNLIGLSFFWQDLARGLVLLSILLAAVVLGRAKSRPATGIFALLRTTKHQALTNTAKGNRK
ncbi:branched-chain amino acid ABC transporter permease [Arthrobacter sp. MYb214]|uniref:ABC transporter permease n=1 Tax=Arthrobacter sp. MYb214 TaxID=1848596 RepID=UPI000CFD2633|nr:ABC transporter permease [Arthrobacter sp. MYb214]PRB75293.1 branched-chain amino acid ABC transporter permease [Arthrobacter sp. MYb214]